MEKNIIAIKKITILKKKNENTLRQPEPIVYKQIFGEENNGYNHNYQIYKKEKEKRKEKKEVKQIQKENKKAQKSIGKHS